MRRTRPQMGKAHHALDLPRVEDGAGTGYRGGLARLAQTHPSAPIVICGLKAGISKPGVNTKSTRGTNGTRGFGSTGGTRIVNSIRGIDITGIASVGGAKTANDTGGIEITGGVRDVSDTPDALNPPSAANGTDGAHPNNLDGRNESSTTDLITLLSY